MLGANTMIDTVVIQPGADTGEPSVAGVSWAAVAAGANRQLRAHPRLASVLDYRSYHHGADRVYRPPPSRSVPDSTLSSSPCWHRRSAATSPAGFARAGSAFTPTRSISATRRTDFSRGPSHRSWARFCWPPRRAILSAAPPRARAKPQPPPPARWDRWTATSTP
jgi:hypothetical protein